ncbi:MAG TPA: PQQ-binding-like beta-propeller repeat protein, partial [Tepidisphaeraceae bacterium]|nr:PQQ-binding-like beta-propeller repeat protein [Tepidisphaeraceae bacterium]
MQQLPVDLGVVPIVVNAGAALGPLLIAPIATFFGILFKPSALLALLRRKPWLPVPIVLGGVGLYFLLAWAFAPAPAVAARGAAAANTSALPIPEGDWTKLAHKLLRDEQFAAKTTGVKPVREYNPEEGMMVLTGPATDPPGAQGRVFAGAAIQDVGSFIGQLFALDKDLQLLWKIEKHGDDDLKAFFSSPVLSPDGKSLIVGQGLHEDKDCALICVDAATGAARWKVQTSLHIESSPAVWKDLVVVGAGAIEDANHKPTGDPGFVLGVQISTGKTLWKHAVNDPESSPAIHPDDGTVYIGAGFNGNAVVALRPEADEDLKGAKRELWRTAAPYPVTGPVTLAGDLVLVGGGTSDFVNVSPTPAGVVMALDRKTGAVRWQTKTPDSVLGRIVTHHNVAYFPVLSGR